MPFKGKDEIQVMVEAELRRRAQEERSQLESLYDWFANSCPCGVPPGKCRKHHRARPKQRPPEGWWRIWFMMAGRNGGKTYPAARFVNKKVEWGHWKEIALVNATIADTRDVMVMGPSGLVATSPPWCKAHFLPTRSQVEWRDAGENFLARAYLRTSEVPDGLRGINADGVWGDEPGKWVKQMETWEQILMVMRRRIVPPPQCVLSGTPTASKMMDELDEDAKNPEKTGVHISSWHTRENEAHMDPMWLAQQIERYDGTIFGQQELGGQLVRRRTGSLWGPEDFDREWFRVQLPPDDLEYIGVAVDPASGSDDVKRASEAGIVVGGRMARLPGQLVSRGVVLDDRSTSGKPGDWGRAAVRAYQDWGANEIIAEKNQGGEMVRHVLETVPAEGGYPSGRNVPVKLVYASVGKTARAEPIQGLYQSGRIRHLRGTLEALERQMLQYLPGKSNQKLDRVDALVWLFAECIIAFEGIGDTGPCISGGERAAFRFEGSGNMPWDDF